jgi:hypothetical protein
MRKIIITKTIRESAIYPKLVAGQHGYITKETEQITRDKNETRLTYLRFPGKVLGGESREPVFIWVDNTKFKLAV